MSINRVPAGVPSGGQYAEGRRGESAQETLASEPSTDIREMPWSRVTPAQADRKFKVARADLATGKITLTEDEEVELRRSYAAVNTAYWKAVDEHPLGQAHQRAEIAVGRAGTALTTALAAGDEATVKDRQRKLREAQTALSKADRELQPVKDDYWENGFGRRRAAGS